MVIITCVSTSGGPLISSISFERRESTVSFLRFVARKVAGWVTVDIEDYEDHSGNDEIIQTLLCFPKIRGIIFRRPRCFCSMCSALVTHAGPDVQIVEHCGDSSDSDGDTFYCEEATTGSADSELDSYDDLCLRDEDDF
ncbi:hypothetical protein RB195_019721 [Necator americanus]|uniref:Uncharacterized protein n=1 Tax=Necator americanus TaxID=51031 RepID=A0ABR1CFG3_NECAM